MWVIKVADITFQDNTIAISNSIEDRAAAFLDEAAGEMASKTAARSRRRTGQTAGAWDYTLDRGKLEATVGNPLKNAIWEEYGTGEYALMGNGRRGGWVYKDPVTGQFYHTYGKTPNRAFYTTFKELENPIVEMAQKFFRELNK